MSTDLVDRGYGDITGVDFLQQNETPVPDCDIITNPPYVDHEAMDAFPAEYRAEPAMAHDGGEDGLTAYRQIIPAAKKFLKPNGLLIFEIGQGQEHDVATLMKQEVFQQFRS